MEFIFSHVDKHHSFYKLALSFFMEVARFVQSNQKKLVIFLQFIKKKEETAFVLYCHAKHSHIWRGSSHVHCFSVFLVSQWSQHFLTWFLVFSNIVLFLLCVIPSLNWVINLSLNWITPSLLENVRRCIPEYSFFGQLDHNIVRISLLFKEGWGVNFDYLPRRGESEKLKKGWKYGPGGGYFHLVYQSISSFEHLFHFSSDFCTYQVDFSVFWALNLLYHLPFFFEFLIFVYFQMLWMLVTVNKVKHMALRSHASQITSTTLLTQISCD